MAPDLSSLVPMTLATVATEAVTFPVWGSIGVVATTEPAELACAQRAVETVIEQFDRSCSRFRDDSEIAAVNAADGAAVLVGETFFDAVAQSLRAASLTDGDVDPTVGEALIALGYDRDFAEVDPPAKPSIAHVPGWHTIQLDRNRRTVRVARGVTLDLGATAKAMAADRAAAEAASLSGCGVLVSLGGDLAVAGPAPDEAWRVRVTDDHRAGLDAPGQWVTLSSGGLATSSTVVRSWRVGDRAVHHVIDPASGQPAASAWRTVSVAAASCLDANIAATAAIIRGTEAIGWLESLALPSRLVSVEGRVTHIAGWPPDGDDLPC